MRTPFKHRCQTNEVRTAHNDHTEGIIIVQREGAERPKVILSPRPLKSSRPWVAFVEDPTCYYGPSPESTTPIKRLYTLGLNHQTQKSTRPRWGTAFSSQPSPVVPLTFTESPSSPPFISIVFRRAVGYAGLSAPLDPTHLSGVRFLFLSRPCRMPRSSPGLSGTGDCDCFEESGVPCLDDPVGQHRDQQ